MSLLKSSEQRRLSRLKRHRRVRKKISGTAERPRLNVFRSAKHIYSQLIDDTEQKVLCSASTVSAAFKEQSDVKGATGNVSSAQVVGKLLAQNASEKGITKVVFDTGGFRYHGRVKALADAAREGGLQF